MDRQDIQKLATLARLEVTEAEIDSLLKEFDPILDYVGQVQSVVVGDEKPHAGEIRNVLREDVNPHDAALYTDELLAAAPSAEKGYIKVKNIL